MEFLFNLVTALAMISKLALFFGTIILTIILLPIIVKVKEESGKQLIAGIILFILNLWCCVTLSNDLPKFETIFQLNSIVWGVDIIVNLIICWGEYFNKKVDGKQEKEEEKEAA